MHWRFQIYDPFCVFLGLRRVSIVSFTNLVTKLMPSIGLSFVGLSFWDRLCCCLCKMGKFLLLYSSCFFSVVFYHASHKGRRGG